MVVLLIALAAAQSAATSVTVEDLRVIDAALDHEARNAERGPRVLFLLDRTLEPCAGKRVLSQCFDVGGKTLTFVQRRIPELTQERLNALASRNVVAQALTTSPARDVIVIPREDLAAAMKQRDANVSASTSLPAYFDDGTALLFLGYHCGGLCGEGNFLLLRRTGDRWKVIKTAMTWIS
jgi:hypothetical protein